MEHESNDLRAAAQEESSPQPFAPGFIAAFVIMSLFWAGYLANVIYSNYQEREYDKIAPATEVREHANTSDCLASAIEVRLTESPVTRRDLENLKITCNRKSMEDQRKANLLRAQEEQKNAINRL